jgi:TfoX/Sxy family transcriptional regulator of competence genes
MTYDEALAARIRDELLGEPGVTERRMFGGLGFMVDDHMAVAAGSGGDLMVRADPATSAQWLDGEAVRPMVMRGRPLAGWLLVSAPTLDDRELAAWVGRAAAYARSLPPKAPKVSEAPPA